MRHEFIVTAVLSLLIVGLLSYFASDDFLWSLILIVPLIALGIYDMVQTKNSIIRNFPVLGRGRYIMEELRPKIYQYFIESDTNGTPISRIFREVVYDRSEQALDTSPYGTQLNVYEEGYEWMNHSISALDPHKLDQSPRVLIGGPDCRQPYSCSILNVSAMSYGSLSSKAVEALNGGARIGHFAHNTGEGGISEYHERFGGDLIYQIGTGYFGSRDAAGNFSPEAFRKQAMKEQVKMIEVKLSQGAKPGHGGILPARKNTEEIAAIRGVVPGTAVISPPYHTAFSNPVGLLEFVRQLRELSDGKPVGFKFCVGRRSEFLAICKAMAETGIMPDFIALDGGEGGTGAAPLEFTNSVGMPYLEGLAFVYDALIGFNLKRHITIIAAGKILTGFHMFKTIALGADVCYSARGMMLALGCIQALECNRNTCPTGVTTQDPELMAGLVVSNKKVRVANYHKETVKALVELMAASGIDIPDKINRTDVYRRVSMRKVRRYDQIFPYIETGCLLNKSDIPDHWKNDMLEANPLSFQADLQL